MYNWKGGLYYILIVVLCSSVTLGLKLISHTEYLTESIHLQKKKKANECWTCITTLSTNLWRFTLSVLVSLR